MCNMQLYLMFLFNKQHKLYKTTKKKLYCNKSIELHNYVKILMFM